MTEITNKQRAARMCKGLITMLEKEKGYVSYSEILQKLSDNLDPSRRKK